MRLACPKSVIFRYFYDMLFSVVSYGDLADSDNNW